jgi:branched-chain amino acid transport system substrate-binding protein
MNHPHDHHAHHAKEPLMDPLDRHSTQRRQLLQASAACGLMGAGLLAHAQSPKLKVGLMLPYSGTFGQIGQTIANGFKLAVTEQGGKLGGREVEYASLDDESDPSKGADRANQLVTRDKVDVMVGTVHSGVQMGILKIARESGVLTIIPNAGVEAATTQLCAPNVFRTSFANGQPAYPMGKIAAERGHKTAVTLAWKYGAGEESVGGFREAFTKGGGKVVKDLWLPFPNAEFQSLLTEIASLKPDAVFVFIAGSGAVKFMKDWQAAGLKGKIALYGAGFLTDGIVEATGPAAEGIETTLHYADGLELERNKAFRLAYVKAFKQQPDVYAVQGYDAGQLLGIGLKAVNGDMSRKKELYAAMESAVIDSPRGKWRMSKGHNPIQDIYLRKVVGTQNQFVSVAMKAVDYPPASLCRMPA